MDSTHLLTIALSAAIVVVAIVLRRKTISWSHPSVVFALFWGGMTLLPTSAVPELTASPLALAFILAIVLAFGAPAFFTNWAPVIAVAKDRHGRSSHVFTSREMLWLFFLVQIASFASILLNLWHQGYDLALLISNPLAISCNYLSSRYSGSLVANVYSQAGTVLNYVGVAAGGLIVASRRTRLVNVAVFVLSFLPSALNVLLYGDKGTIFLAGAYFYGAIIVARTASGNTALVDWATIRVSALAALVVVPIIAAAFLNRTAEGGCSNQGRTAQVFGTLRSAAGVDSKPAVGADSPAPTDNKLAYFVRSYAFGHMFAFSDWFEHQFRNGGTLTYTDPPSQTWGFWTFMSIGRHFNPTYYASLPKGYFDEYFYRPNLLGSNIFTFLRGLIYDFGIIGSLIFMSLFGGISSLCYKMMLRYAYAPVSQTFYVFLIGYIYTSYIISLLIWNSAYASALLLAALLVALHWFLRGRPGQDAHLQTPD